MSSLVHCRIAMNLSSCSLKLALDRELESCSALRRPCGPVEPQEVFPVLRLGKESLHRPEKFGQLFYDADGNKHTHHLRLVIAE